MLASALKSRSGAGSPSTHIPSSISGRIAKRPAIIPDFAIALAEVMGAGEVERGILICGTGVGMSIVANKFPHLRAAVCHDPTTARFSRAHNDANVLTMGSRITGEMVALDIVNAWLHTPFEGGRHSRRLEKIERLASSPASLPLEADRMGGRS